MAARPELTRLAGVPLTVAAYTLGGLPVGAGQHLAVSHIYKRWLSPHAPPFDAKMRFRNGTTFDLDLLDFTQAQAYLTRRYDPELMHFMSMQLSPEDVYLDVGAHVGMVALSIARCLPNVDVHAFEPHPVNAHRLIRNQHLNGITNVTFNQVAVGDKSGEVTLASPGAGSDSHYISDDNTGIRVPCIRLDDYASQHALSEIRLLKVDVEGFEPAALRGAADLIDSGFIKIIICELSHRLLTRSGSSETSLVDWLTARGYMLRELPRLGLHRFKPTRTNHYRNVAFVYEGRSE